MRKKNVLAIIGAVLMICVLGSPAFAANTATMNVTSEPIHYQAISDKGGGFTITFDAGSSLVVGDQITIDLTFGVTLAKAIDLEISNGGSGTPWGVVSTTGSPLTYTGAAPAVVGAGVYFRLHGTLGSQRITLDVMGSGTDSITAGGAAGVDSLILKFLNQGTNAVEYAGDPGIYIQGLTPGTYDVAAQLGDNTLCINVSQYTGTTVHGSMDSASDKFTFVPSNPQIAHVVSALDINFEPCGKRLTGYIPIGTRVTQGSEYCPDFDNEVNGDFCIGTHANNQMVIGASSPFDTAMYTVRMEILVNGQSGDNGVFWTNDPLLVDGYDTQSAACTGIPLVSPATTYQLASGAPATPVAGSTTCDFAPLSTTRAVVMNTAQSDLGLVSSNDYLAFDLPPMDYDLDEIMTGDVVSVYVTIIKVPCGVVFQGEWTIGTFGCPVAAISTTIRYPYFTDMDASSDAYWDGIVVENLSGTNGNVTLMAFEQDGDQGTVTVSINANSMFVGLLSDALALMTQTAGTGTLGDSPLYIIASTTDIPPAVMGGGIDGFAMMGRPDTGEAMGYLPRLMSMY